MTSVLISLVAMLGGVVRSRAALHLEVLALRHQLHVTPASLTPPIVLKAHPTFWSLVHFRSSIDERRADRRADGGSRLGREPADRGGDGDARAPASRRQSTKSI